MTEQRPSPSTAHTTVPRILPNEAEEVLRRGEAIAIDVRPPAAYAAGHIPGALSIPISRLVAELERMPKRRALILYCTLRQEHSSARAARIANDRGFQAYALLGELEAWAAIGGPIAVGANDQVA